MRIPNEEGNCGKYDDVCEKVLRETNAQAACVIVIGGNEGSGFSLSTVNPALIPVITRVLQRVASDLAQKTNN